jgi:hypothetical protein
MTMDIDQIRRDALSLWLRGIRLPLTVVEATVRRGQDTTSWPPALAFEKTEVALQAFVGGLVHDDTLLGAANLQRAEVARREEALAKRAQAEATRAEVSREAKATAAELEAERQRTEETAAQREQRLADDRRTAEQKVTQAAAKKRAATRRQAASRADAIDKTATKGESARLRKEAEALRAKERAVQAKGEALDLDRKVRAKKAARRAS